MNKLLTFVMALLLFPAFVSASIKVGLVLDKGGKDDKSFNTSAYSGCSEAQKKLGIQLKYVEATDDNAFESLLRSFAQKKYDLIIAIGFSQMEAVKKVSAQYKEIKFALVDAQVDAPNVRSLLFNEHEGSYLVGALAALASKSDKIGFIGGMDIPLIRRFEMGYEAGIKKINPKAKLISNYIGVTGDAWNNPPKAKELALSQFAGGVEVTFQAAGASGAGVFDAAEEKNKLAIGTDSNQNWIKPGRILTSMLKRVDVAVYRVIEDTVGGKFSSGTQYFGLADGGIDYAMDEYNQKLVTTEMKNKVDQLKKDIIAKKIIVPDFYKKKK